MNIIEAIEDPKLFRPFLADGNGSLKTWLKWKVALRCVYGLPTTPNNLQRQEAFTGRTTMPDTGFSTALFLTGRRSGKSRFAAILGAYEAALAGHHHKLSKGEQGIVPVLAPTRRQAGIVLGYIRAIFEPPMLAAYVLRETKDGFELKNGIKIEVMSGDYRTVRGFTLVAAVVDEAAFFGLTEESKVRSDTELIRAIKPGLATIGGKLAVISSPYAKKGWCFKTHKNNHGNDNGKVLVWNCASRDMNPTLPQSVVDEALAEDLQSAKSEYLGEFRDDVAEFLPRSTIEACVMEGRREMQPRHQMKYAAFVDLSGGRHDDAALAIGHKDGNKVIVDFQKTYAAPFDPNRVILEMAGELGRFNVRRVLGDNYAAEFVANGFKRCALNYIRCKKPKGELYAELLPRLCTCEIELLDDEKAVAQLAGLERRTRSGGKDIIDHASGAKDDLANAIAGLAEAVCGKRKTAGALFSDNN